MNQNDEIPKYEGPSGRLWTLNTTVSGSISLLSSMLIIIAIFKSQLKLTNMYHRIMLAMSTMDVIGSLAMALTTHLAPSTEEFYDLPHASGTEATCMLQGFGFTFGYMTAFLYVSGLGYYYLCRIHFRMSDGDCREKGVELKIHLVCILVPLLVTVSVVVQVLLVNLSLPDIFSSMIILLFL